MKSDVELEKSAAEALDQYVRDSGAVMLEQEERAIRRLIAVANAALCAAPRCDKTVDMFGAAE